MPDLKLTGIYRLTSIGRPVDPGHPWNRALLIALPLLALTSAVIALLKDGSPFAAAFAALLSGFAAWALTRELAPDDDAAAFVALALAFVGHVAFSADAVLLVFVALFLVRIVNRSTGLAARPFDTVTVLGLVLWVGLAGDAPLILIIGACAFLLDASLVDPLRRHYAAAAICIAAYVWQLIAGELRLSGPGDSGWWVLGTFLLATLAAAWFRPPPASPCDVSAEPLDRLRVDAGLLLGYLLAAQGVLQDGSEAWFATPIWACIAAVPLTLLFRRAV